MTKKREPAAPAKKNQGEKSASQEQAPPRPEQCGTARIDEEK
jgi:hypothetical protein